MRPARRGRRGTQVNVLAAGARCHPNFILAAFPKAIVIATRRSTLAIWQARHIEARLRSIQSGIETAILGMTTEGDRNLATSLAKIGGKGLFIKELEHTLADGSADIAVHSMKDVPVQLAGGFSIAAITEREDARDAFVSNAYRDLNDLPKGSRVGTSSLRRESQLRARFPGLDVQPLRGNVHTRLRKLDDGAFDAVILAAAGLKRLGLEQRITRILPPEEMLPAVGQGALGIECRSDRTDLLSLLAPLDDSVSRWCVEAERALSSALGGSCNVPLGAYAQLEGDSARLRAFVASPDGSRSVAAEIVAARASCAPETLGREVTEQLIGRGARDILAALDSAPA